MARRPVPPVTMRSLDQPAPPRQASGPQPQPSSRTTEAPATWTIASGDTLWHVAEQVASEQAGSPADPEATLAELDRIVALNAERLVVPGNADLVFPGQVFLIA